MEDGSDARIAGSPTAEGAGAACGRIIEIALPLGALGISPGDRLQLSIHPMREDIEAARWPAEAPLTLVYRGEELETEWFV